MKFYIHILLYEGMTRGSSEIGMLQMMMSSACCNLCSKNDAKNKPACIRLVVIQVFTKNGSQAFTKKGCN